MYLYLGQDADHPYLVKLASTLPDLIRAAIAPTTRNKYERAWVSWVDFCRMYNKPYTTTDTFFVATYFNHLLLQKGTRGSINDAFYGIRWGHHSSGYHSPTDHPFVKLAYEGALRLSEYSGTRKKDPMTSDMIKQLVTTYFKEPHNFLHLRFLVVCMLGFAGFMRISEVLSIQIRDINFHTTYMTIHLEKSKTDQLREGNVIYISKTYSKFCAVNITKTYIDLAKLEGEDFLISKLIITKKGHKVQGSQKVSYSRIREIFVELTTPLFKTSSLCLHSLRAGGASAAAENDVTDRMISKHGRWSSERGRDGYIKDSISHRLKVSKSLGL